VNVVRIAMIGDIVGTPGLQALETQLPALIRENKINFVTVNGENAAEGFGMTETEYRLITAAGADAVTSGNHIWEKRGFWPILENEKNMLRPENYPVNAGSVSPGSGFFSMEKNGVFWFVINLQGRDLMSNIDCPFHCFDVCFDQIQKHSKTPHVIIVDFHAESTREKESFAYYADGRASVIAGTHTHVQTADERIMPKGSAYITDLGMTGITDSVIGMDQKICHERFFRQIQFQMKPASSPGRQGVTHGIIAEIDADTGKAVSVRRI